MQTRFASLTSISILSGLLIMAATWPETVHANMISSTLIVPSTSLIPVNPWTLDQIADGNPVPGTEAASDIEGYNGFVSDSTAGTITLDLNGDFDLSSFLLWNDVNVTGEGIKDFSLEFYDSSDALIPVSFSATYQAPQGQLAVAEYVFDEVVEGVSRVDLVIDSANVGPHYTRIEIREVSFMAVPEPGTFALLSLGLVSIAFRQRRRGRDLSSY